MKALFWAIDGQFISVFSRSERESLCDLLYKSTNSFCEASPSWTKHFPKPPQQSITLGFRILPWEFDWVGDTNFQTVKYNHSLSQSSLGSRDSELMYIQYTLGFTRSTLAAAMTKGPICQHLHSCPLHVLQEPTSHLVSGCLTLTEKSISLDFGFIVFLPCFCLHQYCGSL